jgi:hypothetical protein
MMTTVTGKCQSRITESGQDTKGLGCWSYVQLRSKKTKLMIITAYRPTVGHSPSTVWMQQWALLWEVGEINPDPIKIFYDDLASLLDQWKTQGNEIILMIDSNKPIGDRPSKLTGILNKLEMVDLVRHRHPDLEEPNTHIRGTHRIDFMYGTPRVAGNCNKRE